MGILFSYFHHPGLNLYMPEPVLHGRDHATVLKYMLLADPPDGDNPSGGKRQRLSENRFQHEDAFRVVTERPVAVIRHHGL
jgi:hypothetical protein